jgi:hypothetical protein
MGILLVIGIILFILWLLGLFVFSWGIVRRIAAQWSEFNYRYCQGLSCLTARMMAVSLIRAQLMC